ncbi:hypothetical protein GTV15_00515, partial [Streptomyces sp. SID7803]|nr:hypothetical protein [Streptomyces sp. SID7803]
MRTTGPPCARTPSGSVMMDQVSRYLVLSDRAYADTSGVPVRLAYGTRTAST